MNDQDTVTVNQDAEHLRLLSIFHFVLAGLVGLFSLFPLIHLTIGILMVTGAMDDGKNGPPVAIGWLFVIMPLVFITFGLAMAVAIAVAGKRLRQRRSYTFCLVVAGVSCTFMPIGTVLGVFTIIVLVRPSVKELFQGESSLGKA